MITLGSHIVVSEDLAKTIEQSPGSTIEPQAGPIDPRVRAEIAELSGTQTLQRVEVGDTLGEGGMGIVRLGVQKSLGRSVAVKTLKSADFDDAAVLRLLHEGWITGALEHPNIVPVYDLAVDDRGAPVLVLKKIDGTAWSELLANPQRIATLYNNPDVLEANLRIFIQLCRAIEFSHSRAVVHRDIKPENVMLGEFGEVYLLDWGIAVSMRSDREGRLPLADQCEGLAGTLPYMAPEMIEEPPRITEQTDVYLLGATLFEVVTGQPPHEGSNMMAIVHHVLMGTVPYERIEDEDLRQICMGALRADMADRTGSASQLREQIESYLRYREPRALFAQARQAFVLLQDLWASSNTKRHDIAPRAKIYDLYASCRFALMRVLNSGMPTVRPQAALDKLYTLMIEYELDGDDPGAAARIVAEWPAAPDELKARVVEAEVKASDRLTALHKLEREQDPGIGGIRRWRSGLLIGLTWVILPIGTIYPGETWMALHAIPIFQLTILLIFAIRSRQHGVNNQHNRHLLGHAASTMVTQIALTLALQSLGVPVHYGFIMMILLWCFGAALVAVWVHSYYWIAVAAYGLAFVVSMLNPSLRGIAASLSNAALIGVVLYLWRPDRVAPPSTDEC